jgi:hypothetical protein
VSTGAEDAELRKRRSWAALALVVLTLLGLGARWRGVDFLLPHLFEPDSTPMDNQVRVRLGRKIEFPTNQNYPSLVATLAAATAREHDPKYPATVAEHLEQASSFRVGIRKAIAGWSVWIVPVTFLLALRFLTARLALGAAAFLAFSLLHVWFAQQARPHALAAVFPALAVWAATLVWRRGDPLAWLAAGLTAGLAIGSLQFGVAVLPALAVAAWIAHRVHGRTSLVGVGLAASSWLACVVVFYPGTPLGEKQPLKPHVELDGTELKLSGLSIPLDFDGQGFLAIGRTLVTYEPLLGALALIGAVGAACALRRASVTRRRDAWIVLAYVVPFLIALGLFQRTYQRFVLPLLPFFAIAAAYGLWLVASRLAARCGKGAPAVQALVFALALGCQAFTVLRLGQVRAAVDTQTLAAEWLRAEVRDKRTEIAMSPMLDLPLFQTRTALDANAPWMDRRLYEWSNYQYALPEAAFPSERYELRTMETEDLFGRLKRNPDGWYDGLHARYAVIELWKLMRRPRLKVIRDTLQRRARLVASFAPDSDASELPIAFQDNEFDGVTNWFLRMWTAERCGPFVEIYDLQRTAKK